MRGVDNLSVRVGDSVKQRFLDMRVDMCFRLFDEQKIGDRLLSFLVLEFT